MSIRGAIALFAMSLGMGTPLLIIGTSAGKLLPKAGAWMDTVKQLFGALMLGVAAWMLSRLVTDRLALLLYCDARSSPRSWCCGACALAAAASWSAAPRRSPRALCAVMLGVGRGARRPPIRCIRWRAAAAAGGRADVCARRKPSPNSIAR